MMVGIEKSNEQFRRRTIKGGIPGAGSTIERTAKPLSAAKIVIRMR